MLLFPTYIPLVARLSIGLFHAVKVDNILVAAISRKRLLLVACGCNPFREVRIVLSRRIASLEFLIRLLELGTNRTRILDKARSRKNLWASGAVVMMMTA